MQVTSGEPTAYVSRKAFLSKISTCSKMATNGVQKWHHNTNRPPIKKPTRQKNRSKCTTSVCGSCQKPTRKCASRATQQNAKQPSARNAYQCMCAGGKGKGKVAWEGHCGGKDRQRHRHGAGSKGKGKGWGKGGEGQGKRACVYGRHAVQAYNVGHGKGAQGPAKWAQGWGGLGQGRQGR